MDKYDAEIAVLKKDNNIILYNRYLELQKRLDDLLVQYTENHPEVLKVKSEIEAYKAKDDISPKKLAHALDVKNRLAILERDRESSKKMYDEMAAAYSKSEVSTKAELQDKAGTFRIVDPAVSAHQAGQPKPYQDHLHGDPWRDCSRHRSYRAPRYP